MSGLTITEAHPYHGRTVCQACSGRGICVSIATGIGVTEGTCPHCRGSGSLFVSLFDPSCDKCRIEQHNHNYHTKQDIVYDH